MLYKLKQIFLNFLKKVSGKNILIFPKNDTALNNRLTAVKSDVGFWYAGQVLDSSDIAYGILRSGQVEADGTRLVKKFIDYFLNQKDGMIFYDVGANTGYYGVMAAFFGNGKIKTFSFEPVSEYAKTIEQSAYLNRLENQIKVFVTALGEVSGKIEIYLAGSGSTLRPEFSGSNGLAKRSVDVQQLDELAARESLPNPDFIKIDVEGFELSVLKGAEKIISQSRPIIWYESALTMPERGFRNGEFQLVQDFLKKLNYKIFLCQNEQLVSIESAQIPDGVFMYLAVPTEFNLANIV